MATHNTFGELGLSIIGLGAQYPPNKLGPDELAKLAGKFHSESPAMERVLSINRFTGIETRSSVGTAEHPLVNHAEPPSIAELHATFMSDGVPLAVEAARKALAEARVDASRVTHVVSTTCTDSANPGFDHYVARALGLRPDVEKTLLHGVGCAGGLAALRTAANLALGHRFRRRPARVLCVALEVSTTLVRSELDSIDRTQGTRIGACLFSDCASALVLSNGVAADDDDDDGDEPTAEPVYELLGWDHRVIPDTEADLGFDVDPVGWKVVLSQRVPKLTEQVLGPAFADLLAGVGPRLPGAYRAAPDFDWAMHPGGLTILTNAERTLGISPEHMRASYHRYMEHGNSSSATIFSVMDHLRSKAMDAHAPGGRAREYVVGCAFGPGISVEMCMLKRNMGPRGVQTPPETDSEASRSDGGEDDDRDWASLDGGEKTPPVSVDVSFDDTNRHLTTTTAASMCEDDFVSEALASIELD
ncbi:putative chalcone and stilbene synthase domain-containing protein [Rosellinia necatrix]|uniref:Putative chalcone and stilbene synthase domain-containing protein n=1 Tax=Rosellinia necatrix TaxID=77044 RepID=A0A1W2TFI8_ROSNE|nr:putative chalcone and stilbene synthase domain-containing protein [Rosellinia necatrix]